MRDSLQEFQRLEKSVEDAERRKSRAEGALAELDRRLEEFGCSSLEEVPEVRKKLNKEEEDLEKKFRAAMEEFDKQFGNKLEES